MRSLPTRRYARLYERALLSRTFAMMAGWLFSVVLPAVLYWGVPALTRPNPGQKAAFIATTAAFLLSHLGAKNFLSSYPGGRSQGLIAAQVAIFYGGAIVAAMLMRLEISRRLLVASGLAALIWFHIEYVLTRTYLRPKLAVIPGGFADQVLMLSNTDARALQLLDLENVRYDGIVADFEIIRADQERFLTQCALQGIAVYNAKTVYESLTGRVRIDKMSEN